ncbi:MAG: GGDEF domain-containing protein [Planctomycetota bacterium]|nr:GGDEF domain-containing protein [Planctomycetota bacterium]
MLNQAIGSLRKLDIAAIFSWVSVAVLALTQTSMVESDNLQSYWSFSSIGLASCLAFSEIRRRRSEIQVQVFRDAATTDPLTGVGNRRWLDIEMKQRLSQFRRQYVPFSVLMMDIDHFKSINDRWGHDVGDLVIVKVSETIRKTLRDMDVLCRIGGEEFLAILPGTDIKAACVAAERIRHAIEMCPFFKQDRVIPVNLSVGVTAAMSADEIDVILKRADEALYAAKRDGRNRCFVKLSIEPFSINAHDSLFEERGVLDTQSRLGNSKVIDNSLMMVR